MVKRASIRIRKPIHAKAKQPDAGKSRTRGMHRRGADAGAAHLQRAAGEGANAIPHSAGGDTGVPEDAGARAQGVPEPAPAVQRGREAGPAHDRDHREAEADSL